jgi:hypothetical protein
VTDVTEFLDDLVHEPSQIEGHGVDLTVEYVARIEGAGDVDFGGDEYEAPEAEAVRAERRSEDDDYGWYELDAGTYVLRYNETLSSAENEFLLQPHPRLLALGVIHPTVRLEKLRRVPMTVPEDGVNIKENARVSTLLVD